VPVIHITRTEPVTKPVGFEVGKHYKCIDDRNMEDITFGNYYKIIQGTDSQVKIITDRGNPCRYSADRFDPVAREDEKPNKGDYKSCSEEFFKSASEHLKSVYHVKSSNKDFIINSLINQKEEVKMGNRRVVNVQLMDDDKGLDINAALVNDFGDVVTEDNDEITIQQLIMDTDMRDILEMHNNVRTEQVDLDILQRTGQVVNLRPVKLKQLRWIIK
jgi:hypothetical protein